MPSSSKSRTTFLKATFRSRSLTSNCSIRKKKKKEEKKSEENKYDIIKKITKKTSRETTNDVQGMKTSEVLDKNLTENSQKYVNVNSEVNRRPETENIYDHVKS